MKQIPVIKFHKDKYGDELLIDVVRRQTEKTEERCLPTRRQARMNSDGFADGAASENELTDADAEG